MMMSYIILNMESGIIFDIKKFSTHDGPGIRTTVFLKGCPLSCWWCHNPESQRIYREKLYAVSRCIGCKECLAVCTEAAIREMEIGLCTDPEKCLRCGSCTDVCLAEACEMAGRELTVNQVMAEIEKDTAFYDESFGGVTFSGGEPLAQPDFLFALLKACRDRQIHTALDTSGFSTWNVLDRIRHHVDVFLFDLKLMDDEKHRRVTGVSNRTILENLLALSSEGHRIRIRLPVIPGITDDEDNVSAIGVFAAGLPSMPQIDLLPYHHSAAGKYERLGKGYLLPDTRPPAADSMARLADLLRRSGLTVNVEG
jgi:pyruvate formate lyase activating enzyme